MKLGNLILIAILAAIGYHLYSTLQAPRPAVTQVVPAPAPVPAPLTPAPVAVAPVTPAPETPAPVAAAPVTPAGVAAAASPAASPTPSGSWMYSVTSTPYDQVKSRSGGRKH
jgi:hypothetical protein